MSPSAGPALRCAAACLLLAAGAASAQSVTFNGSLGQRKALLVIDGEARTLSVGESFRGVKLLALSADQAQVEVGGQRMPLRIGAAPVRLGSGASGADGRRIVMTAGLGGHFTGSGSINGRATQFLVDTGATAVAIGQADAARIGLDLATAQRVMASTANGQVPVHRLTLSVVRLGDVEVHNVDAIVMPGNMEHVLLGNSFLTRFQMRRENDQLTLDKRP